MSSDGGMDHTREALGGCCPAALHYDRKVSPRVFGGKMTLLMLENATVSVLKYSIK